MSEKWLPFTFMIFRVEFPSVLLFESGWGDVLILGRYLEQSITEEYLFMCCVGPFCPIFVIVSSQAFQFTHLLAPPPKETKSDFVKGIGRTE